MKTNLSRWVRRAPDISAVTARFPIAVLLMAIFTLIVMFVTLSYWNEKLGRVLTGIVIAAYTCVCISLASEANGRTKSYILQGVVATAILALAWFSESLRLNLVMAVGAVVLILGNMVIWRGPRDDLHVWDFTHKLWTGAIFAIFGSIIFFLGVIAIQFALKSLFGLRVNDLTEHLILPIGLGFLAPLYWMSTLPAVDEPYEELYAAPGFVSKAVAFLGTWLLAPLTLIYAAIILAYGVKILAAGSLPKGEIGQLVTPFLIVGTLTWLLLEPPFIKTKALAKIFRKLWFPISIPAALLLALAVSARISAYGLTPERIALIFAVLWALALGLWFSFGPKAKRDIRLIPAGASVLLVLCAFGASAVSTFNQARRLDAYLAKAGITAHMTGEVKDKEAAQRAKGAIEYLNQHNGAKALKNSLAKVGYDKPVKLGNVYSSLGLTNIKTPSRYHDRFQRETSYYSNDLPIDISGYDVFHGHDVYDSPRSVEGRSNIAVVNNITMSIKDHKLQFSLDGENLTADVEGADDFDLMYWVSALSVDVENERNLLVTNPSIQVYQDDELRIGLVIKSVRRWLDDTGDVQMSLDYYLLSGPVQ